MDEEDRDRLARFNWRLLPSGYVARRAMTHGVRHIYYLQREVVGATHADLLRVEHANGDKLDNRRGNLHVRSAAVAPPAARSPVSEEAWSPDTKYTGRSETFHARAGSRP